MLLVIDRIWPMSRCRRVYFLESFILFNGLDTIFQDLKQPVRRFVVASAALWSYFNACDSNDTYYQRDAFQAHPRLGGSCAAHVGSFFEQNIFREAKNETKIDYPKGNPKEMQASKKLE